MADRLECISFDFTRIMSLLSFIRLEFSCQQDEIGFVPEPCWWRWQTGWRGCRGVFNTLPIMKVILWGVWREGGGWQIKLSKPALSVTPPRKGNSPPSATSVTPRPRNLSIAQDVSLVLYYPLQKHQQRMTLF